MLGLCRSLADEHAARAETHARRWADARAAHALLQAKRRIEVAGAVAEQMVSMVAQEAVYRGLADGALPSKHVRGEWVAAFVTGAIAPAHEQVGRKSTVTAHL